MNQKKLNLKETIARKGAIMNFIKLFRGIISFALLCLIPAGLLAQPVVKAEIFSPEYNVGDRVKVLVNLENNPGLHSLFFDLGYDDSVLSFEGIRKGRMITNAPAGSEFLYAVNSASGGFSATRIVVSFSLEGYQTGTSENGVVAEISFRVTAPGAGPYSFVFNEGFLLDGRNIPFTGVSWQDSDAFSIVSPYTGAFILIRQPYENQVVTEGTVPVSLIASEGDYLVRLTNNILPSFDTGYIPLHNGRLLQEPVALNTGMNVITAELYAPGSPEPSPPPIFLTLDTVKVYRPPSDNSIRIIDPANHSLLNTDMVEVRVSSALDAVEINGLTAAFDGEMDGTNKIFHSRIWLKDGFNSIIAQGTKASPQNLLYENTSSDWLGDTWLTDHSAGWTPNEFAGMYLEIDGMFAAITDNSNDTLNLASADNGIYLAAGAGYAYRIRSGKETEAVTGVTFKDQIQVYYQKDDSIFRFIRPLVNENFKPSVYNFLSIKGEIDSAYKTFADPATGGPVKNTVTLAVVYKPANPLKSPRMLVDNRQAVIGESDFGYGEARSKYVFYNDFAIPLEGLDNGEIEITAYKNKNNEKWDDKITRVVFVDAGRLWIDLVQPNIFTSDILDSEVKIRNFNETNPVDNPDGNIQVTNEGALTLKTSDPTVELQNIDNVRQVAEGADGSLYALVNSSTSLMRIYKKEHGAVQWELLISRSGMYGYSLVSTEIGLLVGVSNIPSNGNSGLYLVAEGELVNFTFPGENLAHIQFVSYHEETVRLYGSLYDYLYTFNLYNIEETGGKYRVSGLVKIPFYTSDNIEQFILSPDGRTAAIRTDRASRNILFYSREADGFYRVTLPPLGDESEVTGSRLVYAPYENSEYAAYIVLKGNENPEVIMANTGTGRFFRTEIQLDSAGWFAGDAPINLVGAGFTDSLVTFLYATPGGYVTNTGKVFFNQFYPAAASRSVYLTGETINLENQNLFLTSRGGIYAGIDPTGLDPAADPKLYQLYHRVAAEGTGSFSYINPDVDGLRGFDFEINPLDAARIDFGFTLVDNETGVPRFSLASATLADLLNGDFSTGDFVISDELNDATGRTVLHFEFAGLAASARIDFIFTLRASGEIAPAVYALEIYKKIPARLANVPGETIVVPIQGYVYDRTVSEVYIQHIRVLLERDGSFAYNYTVTNTASTVPIEISATNRAGERVELHFNVEIVESVAGLWGMYYAYWPIPTPAPTPPPLPLVPMGPEFRIDTDKRELHLTGKYCGLAGAVVGYELYSTDQEDGEAPRAQGRFEVHKAPDAGAVSGLPPGSDYEAGDFVDQVLELLPNEQRLVLFVENPGGQRFEYKINKQYPVFNYSMPPWEQRIELDADREITESVDGIPVLQQMDLAACESETAPYIFTAEGTITGQIRALEQFDEILVRSYTSGLTFEGGVSETIVPVKAGNRLEIPFHVTMGTAISRDFDVVLIPTIPVYKYMKEGIRITVTKSFADTFFKPDFSIIHPENWTDEQKRTLDGIPARFQFTDREDVPLPVEGDELNTYKVVGTFSVNFATDVSGFVDVYDSEYFGLFDTETGALQYLDGLKEGKNRIQWSFVYIDAYGNQEVMSSSFSGRPGMTDEVFTFTDDSVIADTVITFDPYLDGRYYDNSSGDAADHLPHLTIGKDAGTELEMLLNGKSVWRDTESRTAIPALEIPPGAVRQGRNELAFLITDKYGNQEKRDYRFLYDSAAPVVAIASIKMDSEYHYLIELTATVNEANFDRGYLYYGADIINHEPEVRVLGEAAYELYWSGLEEYALDPSVAGYQVTVKAVDAAGRTGTAEPVTTFKDLERPGIVPVREMEIKLPLYNGVPATENEKDYVDKAFANHAKFAPQRLLERVSVKDEVEANRDVLVRNLDSQKLLQSDHGTEDWFGMSVAISGEYAIVGAPVTNTSTGSASIFKLDPVKGEWKEQVPKLQDGNGEVGDGFGQSVAISGDYAFIGVPGDDDDKGSVYVLKLDPVTGKWEEQIPKLQESNGETGDRFGQSVAISGDYVLVGAPNDNDNKGAVYVFKLDQTTGEWVEQTMRLQDSNGEALDRFGYSLAISGEYALVGAPLDDSSKGSVNIFKLDMETGNWSVQKLQASNGVAPDQFGQSVAISGEYAVIGASQHGTVGAVYIYKLNPETGEWEEQLPRLQASDITTSAGFGRSVAISGEYVIVGSPNNDNQKGAVSVFKLNPETEAWEEQLPKLQASDRVAQDYFGFSVAISGEYVITGAYHVGFRIGAAYTCVLGHSQGVLSSDFCIDAPGKHYLVFQIKKDSFGMATKENLIGKITFEVSGIRQDPGSTPEFVTLGPITLSLSNEQYVEGLNYLYYMVDIEELKTQFMTLAPSFGAGEIPFDRGTLRIVYDQNPNPFTPYDIFVTGEATSALDDIVVFDPAYQGTSRTGYAEVDSHLQHPKAERTVTLTDSQEALSLLFWLRIEDEGATDELYENRYKRLVTFRNSGGEELYHLGYRGTSLELIDEVTYASPQSVITPMELSSSGSNGWHLISLLIDPNQGSDEYSGTIKLRVYDAKNKIFLPGETTFDANADFLQSHLKSVLTSGASFYFGADTEDPAEDELFDTGFYSIANPLYIGRLLSDEEILRIAGLNDYSGVERFYPFDNSTADFGTGEFLHPEGTDYFTALQNHDYTAGGGGAFKASGAHPNFLETRTHPGGGNYVVLRDAGEAVTYNVTVTGWANSFSINASPGASSGRYYFGDKAGPYGLGLDRWYSVAGKVLFLAPDAEARLVMRINGKTQVMALSKGPFRFIYDNSAFTTPVDVKLYIETTGAVTIANDLSLNEGNYVLPEAAGFKASAASTSFPFGVAGTVAFWYKPFVVNADGSVNYDLVLFDSEYIKIGADESTGRNEGEAAYYVEIKQESGLWKTLKTDVNVRQGWHYLQFSYNWDNTKGVWYFYIDGALAACFEGAGHELFGTLAGDISAAGDNVRIGSNLEKTVYAEGYIDDVHIGKYYEQSLYTDNTPVTISYDETSAEVVLDYGTTNPADVSDLHYILVSLDGTCKEEGETFNVSLAGLPSGRYGITTSMLINGYEYTDLLTFNIDSKPRFVLASRTPLVFSNKTIAVDFKYEYDRAYRYGSDSLHYAGAATRISCNGGLTETVYLVQDFISQDSSRWLTGRPDEFGRLVWTPVTPDNSGLLPVSFPGITPEGDITCSYEYFYFINTFDPAKLAAAAFADGDPEDDVIPLATLLTPEAKYETFLDKNDLPVDYYYMLETGVRGDTGSSHSILEDITIEYEVFNVDDPSQTFSGEYPLDGDLRARMYFDDILPAYGTYEGVLRLKYQGIPSGNLVLPEPLVWKQRVTGTGEVTKALEIKEFSLLSLDKNSSTAGFYLGYAQANMTSITYKLTVSRGTEITCERTGPLSNLSATGSIFITAVPVPRDDFSVEVKVSSGEFVRRQELALSNRSGTPEIVVTNWPESLIAYNDVLFSWKGYLEGEYNEEIEYSYNFDGQGDSTWNSDWRSIRFYNLEEGSHTFAVRAAYKGTRSAPTKVNFFVDIQRPVFHEELINTEELRDAEGVLYAVNITGRAGAVTDASLRSLSCKGGGEVTYAGDGSFTIRELPVTVDGENIFRITATDAVGNYTDFEAKVSNPLTSLIFPDTSEYVRYSPLTIVGRINDAVETGLRIYLKDALSPEDSGSTFSGWKEARINEDRTFFIEDVFVNPGSKGQAIATPLTLVSVFGPDKIFRKEITVYANEILLPIELGLSTHAVEGENSDTLVNINCYANVENISSWSVDFDGDGVYDAIDLVDDPSAEEARIHDWPHTYSSIGLVEPRVRIITTDGNFFSVADRLVIHEKIKEAAHKIITDSISFSSVTMEDNSRRIFVLTGSDPVYTVDVYQIGRNDTYISNRLFRIDLESTGITTPSLVRALDGDKLLITAGTAGAGTLHLLAANEFGNYGVTAGIELPGTVRDITFDDFHIYISYSDRNYITRIPRQDGLPVMDEAEDLSLGVFNTVPVGANAGLAKDALGLLVADYYNQRVVRFTNALGLAEQFGSIGTGEKEFLSPTLIATCENRIFVYDQRRGDIQVFDQNFTPVTTLEYRSDPDYYNYLEADFFLDLADISIMTRAEGDRDYYYALMLSRSGGKLALLRLPQWEELRARVRNNKIVYLQDGEIFMAKPDGSDLARLLSSDSLPRIEGQLDYPSLSPDGRKLVFTSRLNLYIGAFDELKNQGSEYAYDHIYVYDIEGKDLKKLHLEGIEGYELERPVFNSNGDELVFSAKETGGRWQIYKYDFTNAGTSRLFETDENARFPYYSPDDDYLVFTTDYDGDEDIVIIPVNNPAIRFDVTGNNARDSLPVWIATYPGEVNDQTGIVSKIAYVSERESFRKGIYYVYIQHIPGEGGVNIVTAQGDNIGADPDSAAIAITTGEVEDDYPSFCGDGTAVVFQHSDGETSSLMKYDQTADPPAASAMPLPGNAARPAGMKNMITNFTAKVVNGNELALNWDSYTEKELFYIVELTEDNAGAVPRLIKVLSRTGTVVKGLSMGQTYRVRVYIREIGEEVATSRMERVEVPPVAARPSFEIDEKNPYLVHLHAWRPEQIDTLASWNFAWIIDNNRIPTNVVRDFSYEFATSGEKTIMLEVSAGSGSATYAEMSEPFVVDIVSNIDPVIEYVLAEDGSYLELSGENSLGSKLDFASATWAVSGPGGPMIHLTGPRVVAQLDAYSRKVNVALSLSRIPVNGQQATDTIVRTTTIDLDYRELLPVITTERHEESPRLFTFSGQESRGNIDWYRTRWVVYADNAVLYQTEGVSTFAYQFPERSRDTIYTVSLTIPRRNDGSTETVSRIVSVEAAPIEPVIDYKILTLTEGNQTVGQKVVFDATTSTGSGIDFNMARWSVPAANTYGEQAVQVGPTATYNLVGINTGVVIEVALTLSRAGGTDAVTTTQLINIKDGEAPQAKLVVNPAFEESATGTVLILDVLQSTGPNIDWERTDWLIDNGYTRKGPVVRYEAAAKADGEVVTYTVTLYRHGGLPETKTGQVTIGGKELQPLISYRKVSPENPNVYELSVLDTRGANIDWERTRWYIYDGNQSVVEIPGSVITHAFALSSERMGYPVLVEMFFKGDTHPFTGYKTVNVEGDELLPIVTMEVNPDAPHIVALSAEKSLGGSIDWAQTKWTFLDSTESQYGPVITHAFPSGTNGKTFTVLCTLYRRLAGGQTESGTSRKEVSIGASTIVPKITAKVFDQTLIISAEASEGYGLLLDRAVWSFPGEGDNASVNESIQTGTIHTENFSLSAQATVGYSDGIVATVTGGIDSGHTDTSYNDYKNTSTSFTTSNMLVGPLCRRYVGNAKYQIVTLYVYRYKSNGGVEGKSITVNVDLTEARAKAQTSGVIYK